MKITGTFEVSMNPLDTGMSGAEGFQFARRSIDKVFKGELDASSVGEMLSVVTCVQGSAGYVAMETVTGNLCGLDGSFVLQHYGTMREGSQLLVLEIVPDSGTDDLAGITGKMAIKMEDGQHFYEFEYELPG
ncbi:MAG: DUF3224 domain-containing protein [Methyloligellaceae bacterium]